MNTYVLVVWARYCEGELSEAAMQQHLEAFQAAIRKRLEDYGPQTNTLGALCLELLKSDGWG